MAYDGIKAGRAVFLGCVLGRWQVEKTEAGGDMFITSQRQKFQQLLQAESHTEEIYEERQLSEAETNMLTDPWHENCGLLSFYILAEVRRVFTKPEL